MGHHRLVAMTRGRLGRLPRLFALGAMLAMLAGWNAVVAPRPADALSTWTGGVNLYRSGVFTTQRSWLWCTAANVQIMRNIVFHKELHSAAGQREYFNWMRAHNRYNIPVSDGVDPQGWRDGLRHWVDRRYSIYGHGSFTNALKSAVRALRISNRPVGLLVARGNHAWILNGFTASADPARTWNFTVTSVRVTGPLWGLQSRSYGYDMAPNRKLTPSQLRGFWTPWHYSRIRMVWEGEILAIQPVV